MKSISKESSPREPQPTPPQSKWVRSTPLGKAAPTLARCSPRVHAACAAARSPAKRVALPAWRPKLHLSRLSVERQPQLMVVESGYIKSTARRYDDRKA